MKNVMWSRKMCRRILEDLGGRLRSTEHLKALTLSHGIRPRGSAGGELHVLQPDRLIKERGRDIATRVLPGCFTQALYRRQPGED